MDGSQAGRGVFGDVRRHTDTHMGTDVNAAGDWGELPNVCVVTAKD